MLKTGDRVKVVFPLKDQIGIETIKRFHNMVTTVKEVHGIKAGKPLYGCSYTLVGCTSRYGVDYEFCEEWLVPLDKGE